MLFLSFLNPAVAKEFSLWIAGAEGVELCKLDTITGRLSSIQKTNMAPLTWLASSEEKFVYGGSVLPGSADPINGALSAFRINSDKSWTLLSRVPSLGKTTVHLTLSPSGRNLYAVNFRHDSYTSRGSVVNFALNKDGSIGNHLQRFEHPGQGGSRSNRQLASHPHSIVKSHNQEYVAVADLGVDQVFIYRVDTKTEELKLVSRIQGQPGQQPRHLVWHPSDEFLYCMNEASPTVSVAEFHKISGKGKFVQHVKRTQNKGGGGADICMDSEGRWLFGSNRGEDTIVAYTINSESGHIHLIGHVPTGGGSTRSIAISPDDQWLIAANQANHSVTVFFIDQANGTLKAKNRPLQIESPACVLFCKPEKDN